MKALILEKTVPSIREEKEPLRLMEIPKPRAGEREIIIKTEACGICHTELDEIEGRLPPAFYPMILGHQVAGIIAEKGRRVSEFSEGQRAGAGWIFSACGECGYCRNGLENLCENFRATGRDAWGGYAGYFKITADFAVPLPEEIPAETAAPLLCAGSVGYRSLRLTGIRNGETLGLTGFGGSGHLVLQMARYLYPDSPVFVFARNPVQRDFALSLGAAWSGDTAEKPPEPARAVIDTTPVWKPVLPALQNLYPGGRLVINAIRKEEKDKNILQKINYAEHLWQEKEIKSTANVTRKDILEFLNLAASMKLKPEIQLYAPEEANRALVELKTGKIRGSKVIKFR